MRMFVALPLPADVVVDLDRFCEPRRHGDEDWVWTRPHQWHLTLAFLADVAPLDLDPLGEALATVAERREPLELRLDGAGVFGHPDQANVLWARPAGEVEGVTALARAVRSAVQSVGVEFDGRRFTPHITLARSRRGVSATRWLRVFQTYTSSAWSADELVLFSSTRQGAGGPYDHRVEDRWPLGQHDHRSTDDSHQPHR